MRSTDKAKEHLLSLKGKVNKSEYREIAKESKKMARRQLFPAIMYPHVKEATKKITNKSYEQIS